jgi:hypothetical protein
MKTPFTKTFIFLTLLFFTFNLKAQNRDYIITVKGDTINCKIIGEKYKAEGMDNPKHISFYEIKEYYIAKDNILNRAVYLPEHRLPQFMTVLESGKINLYEHTKEYYHMNSFAGGMSYSTYITEWYIAKETDTVAIIKNSDIFLGAIFFKPKKTRKNDFAEMIKDNKVIHDKFIAEDKFSIAQIRNLIHLYNQGLNNIAQPFEIPKKDYVVTRNKDTIFCKIEPATFNTVSRYRVNDDSKFTRIDTTITEYFLAYNSSNYLLKTLPNNKHREYVKLIERGAVNLYSYSFNNTDEDNDASLYASKGTGELVQIKHSFTGRFDKDEKKAIIDLFSDDPNLSAKIENLPHDFTAILTCVKMYNSDYLANIKPVK